MVHNRLPVSDTKIYSIAQHPSPCHTNAHIHMYAIFIVNRLYPATPPPTHALTRTPVPRRPPYLSLCCSVLSDTPHHPTMSVQVVEVAMYLHLWKLVKESVETPLSCFSFSESITTSV